MAKEYSVRSIEGPFIRLDQEGRTEKYLTIKAKTAGGVNFEIDTLQDLADPEKLKPILREKAVKLDSILSA